MNVITVQNFKKEPFYNVSLTCTDSNNDSFTATRAGIIEKLITTGFIIRNKKQLLPTEKGINLIKVVPENVKSPQLTAEWEACLSEIEQGKKDFNEFLDEIKHLAKELTYENKTPIEEFKNLFPRQAGGRKSKELIGKCSRCGGDVLEWDKVFSCSNKECDFALFKREFDEQKTFVEL